MNAHQMWFGTENSMRWIDTPQSGADSTPEGWASSGSLLGGGGYALHSWGSHKVYQYSWRNSSAREAAQLMKSYRDGVYGRGLIYFISPLIYDTNILPAQLAAPSMNVQNDGALRFGRDVPILVDNAPSGGSLDLPVTAAHYTLSADSATETTRVFIPIPAGYQLHLGAFFEGDNARPEFTLVDTLGVVHAPTQVPKMDVMGRHVASPYAITGRGVYISFAKMTPGAPAELAVQAMVARLSKINTSGFNDLVTRGPWVGGQGHSGCRFDGTPTYIEYSGYDGGQVGYAASFREVGLWE